jgi:ribosomal protein L28
MLPPPELKRNKSIRLVQRRQKRYFKKNLIKYKTLTVLNNPFTILLSAAMPTTVSVLTLITLYKKTSTKPSQQNPLISIFNQKT